MNLEELTLGLSLMLSKSHCCSAKALGSLSLDVQNGILHPATIMELCFLCSMRILIVSFGGYNKV